MKVLIACDKFKGSLGANEVCEAIKQGIEEQRNDFDCIVQPIADGGDGTMLLLRDVLSLDIIELDTVNPLGHPIKAKYYTDSQRAFIELAEASGITRLESAELNPMKAHIIGTGILIRDAIDRGYNEIVLGLGGSCTNDAGLGIAYALGYKFKDDDQSELIPCGGNLLDIRQIEPPSENIEFRIKVLCDVKNPLYGLDGAAHTYAAQKGADKEQIIKLEAGLKHVSLLIQELKGVDIGTIEGGGAAGGIAAGLIGLYGAESQSGFDYINELTAIEDKIKNSDVIITGEGKLDEQSIQGKVVGRIAELCLLYHKPLIVIAGDSDIDIATAQRLGINKIYTIMSRAKGLSDAMNNSAQYLIEIGRDINKISLGLYVAHKKKKHDTE